MQNRALCAGPRRHRRCAGQDPPAVSRCWKEVDTIMQNGPRLASAARPDVTLSTHPPQPYGTWRYRTCRWQE